MYNKLGFVRDLDTALLPRKLLHVSWFGIEKWHQKTTSADTQQT